MNNHTQVAPSALQISDIIIRQDSEGRYCLNDLYKASGNNPKHKPSEWLRNKQAKDLIAEIELEAGIPAIKTIKGHRATGTYVVKELVYAYAMWISASFSLKVIRAYDALQSPPVEKAEPLPPHQLSTKILFCIDNGVTTQQVVPYGCCIIDPKSLSSLKSLLNSEIPPELLPDILELVSMRMGRHFRRVLRPSAKD